ncbi:unnamed protein product [Dicrocoelium dendriticum]|nr:unnamed protein product [Dicrocoelium dendriticum]
MRKLLVTHSRINTLICHYRYTLTILAVRMNHHRLVVCVEDGIFIHNIRDMQMLHRVEETPPNRNGVIALSSADDNCYLAYPGSHRVGMVYIFDAMNFQNVTSIAAHDGLLAALAFNPLATLLATASEKGTVIRVFSIPHGDKLMEFRRGLTRCVSICCLSFSLNNQFLVAASHTETLHVFKLETRSSDHSQRRYSRQRTVSSGSGTSQGSGNACEDTESISPDDVGPQDRGSPLVSDGSISTTASGWGSGIVGWMGSTLKAYSSYLPHQVSEIFAQDRAFAYARLPTSPPNSLWTGAGRGSPVLVSGVADHLPVAASAATGLLTTGSGVHKVAAIVYHQNQPRLIVAGLDGLAHIFAIDSVHGGEATLLRTQRLLSPNPSSTTCPRPIGLGTGTPPSEATVSSTKDSVGPHLTGGPQHPGVYIASRASNGTTPSRATSFAAAVIGTGTSKVSDAEGTAVSPPATAYSSGDS